MTTIHAALEIGTTRTVLAIGEVENGGRLKVVSYAAIPSSGVRKSQITDINHATQSIRSVIAENEKKQLEIGASMTIGNAFLVVSGQHIAADSFEGVTQISGSKVTADDINEVLRSSRQMKLGRDRELLDIVDQDYVLDSLGGIQTPKGMSGRILKVNTLQISADINRINDARTAANGAHLEIREPLFATTCAADAVLADYEKRNGVLVIDIGGGSTGYAAYSDGYLAQVGAIGVGGDHITNDIAHAFQTTQDQAEKLKTLEACATPGVSSGDPRVKLPGSSPLMESRTVSRRALDTVVNARVRETFGILREKLIQADLIHRLHAGVIITGGGAALKGIDAVIQRELEMPVRIGRPIHVDGLSEVRNPESFAAVAGALMYAHSHCEEKSFLQSLLGGFLR